MGSDTVRECELPVVDLREEKMKPGSEEWGRGCDVVRRALEEHGCFVALYDKVGSELWESVLGALEELFELPLETKKQETSEKLFHSYFGVEWLPLYESVAIDNALTTHGCQNFTNIMWPQGNPPFWYLPTYHFIYLYYLVITWKLAFYFVLFGYLKKWIVK